MGKLKEYSATIVLCAIVILSSLGYLSSPESLESYMTGDPLTSALMVALLMGIATVIAPITLLPLIPLIAPILGPFTTGLACWAGWTLGSVIAFWIARHGGRPLLHKFVRMERLNALERRIPKQSHFLLIFALRLIIPVDILSYALGLFSSVRMSTYALASALGILWFSFALAYFGYFVTNEGTVLLVGYSVVSAIIFGSAFWYVRLMMKKET